MSEAPAIPAHLPAEPKPAARERLFRDVVGDLLRRIRQDQGRTLRDVAGRAQVSVPYLSEIERGRKEASSEVLSALCRSLGIEMGELMMAVGRVLVTDTGRVGLDLTSARGIRPSTHVMSARISPRPSGHDASAFALAA